MPLDEVADKLLKSFDARVWAETFVAVVKERPSIPFDEAAMTSWFSNALMRGYDERAQRSKDHQRRMRRIRWPWYHWRRYIAIGGERPL